MSRCRRSRRPLSVAGALSSIANVDTALHNLVSTAVLLPLPPHAHSGGTFQIAP